MNSKRWVRLLLAASLAAPFAASAQEVPPAAPAPAPAPAPTAEPLADVEEIVVTSRKREESLQDVPFAVSAKTGDDLREAGSESLEDISRIVPSLSVQNLGPGQSQVAMRGMSAGQIVRDQPGVKEQVGIYLDESVVSLSLFTPDLDLFDLNRVEVLRGPQGTLFGSGSVSGTIRYITNQPNLEEVEAAAEGGINFVQDGGRGGDLKGMINMPLVEGKLGLRVAGYWTAFPGFIDAFTPTGKDEDVNEGDRWGFRASLLFQPSDVVSITPRVVYQQVEVNGFNRVDRFNILANEYTTTRPTLNLGHKEQFRQFTEEFTDKFLLADLNVAVQVTDWLTLTSVTSFTDRDLLMTRDATQLTASITGGSIGLAESVYTLDAPLDDETDVRTVTQELRVAARHEIEAGALNSIDWVLGYFYSNLDRDYGQTLFVDGFEAATGIPTAGIVAGTDELFFSRIPYELLQEALFGETTLTMFDILHLTAGVRWYTYDEERVLNFDGIFADRYIENVGTDPQTGQPVVAPSEVHSDGFTPRFIVSLTPTEDLEFSLQASRGFRLGGINDPLNNFAGCTQADKDTFGQNPTYGDEKVWNYEAGAKASLLDGRATVNGAVFYSDIEDLQGTYDVGNCSSRVILNIPEARAVGVEWEIAATPIDNFDFAVGGSYTDAELRSTLRVQVPGGGGPVLPGTEKGNRLPTIPELQINAAATYTLPGIVGDFDGFGTMSYQHVGSRWTQIGDQDPAFWNPITLFQGVGNPITPGSPPHVPGANDQILAFNAKLDAYDLLNTRVGVRNDRWEIAFYINNLTDERAELALDRERGGRARVGYLTNQPRTFGFSGRVTY